MDIKYPVGYAVNEDELRIAVNFPKKLFHDIVAMAKKEKRTFNAMVMELVKCGKLDLEESDKHEIAA